MRCKNCGSIMQSFLLGNGGKRYFDCRRGITTLLDSNHHIISCNTIQSEDGTILKKGDVISYLSGGKAEIYKVE